MIAFCAAIAASLLNAAWQGALLSVAVALVLRLLPGTTAALRSFVWSMVFLAVVWLHFVPASGAPSAHHAGAVWSLAIAATWLAAAAYRALQLVFSLQRVRALCRDAKPTGRTVAVPHRRSALLCTSSQVSRPTVIGFFHPRVLLPEALYDTLTANDLNYILLHETTHLRRGDDWTNLLQKLALVLFPLNPALLWVEHRLCREREFACDDQVIAATRSPRSYALCLTSLAERGLFARASSLALGAWHRRSELALRVQRMLSRPGQKMPRAYALTTGIAMCAGLAAGASLLSRGPQLLSFTQVPMQQAAIDVRPAVRTYGGSMVLAKQALPARALDRASATPRFVTAVQRVHAQRVSWRSARFVSPRHHRAAHAVPAVLDQRTPFAQRVRYSLAVPSTREFVPVAACAVATPDGWILLTL